MWTFSDIRKERLKRHECGVEEIQTFSLSTKTGKFELDYREFFNDLGWHVRCSRYRENKILNEKKFIYSKDYRDCKEVNIRNSVPYEFFEYKYDSQGNQTDYLQFNQSNELCNHQKTVYNQNNLDKEMYSTKEYGSNLFLSQRYYYNVLNQLIRVEELSEEGDIDLAHEIRYDQQGRISEYYIDTIVTAKKLQATYFYDSFKRTQERKSVDAINRTLKFFDEDDFLMRSQIFKNETLISDKEYKYKKTHNKT